MIRDVLSDTHTLFTPEDFTAEEIARGNVLAVAVVDEGASVCKDCGDAHHLLEAMCRASRAFAQLDICDRNFEENLRNELGNDDE